MCMANVEPSKWVNRVFVWRHLNGNLCAAFGLCKLTIINRRATRFYFYPKEQSQAQYESSTMGPAIYING